MTALVMAAVALAQAPPSVFVPPPPPVSGQPDQPNPANPNQRVRAPRPDAPGPREVRVTSDYQESEGDIKHLRGHVVIDTIDRKLEADEVDYNTDTNEVEARGNVRFENYNDGEKLECDHGKYNYNEETGIFYDVRGTSPPKIVARPGLLLSSNPFYFEGKWAERKEDRYILHDGFVTDCTIPRPWWRLVAPRFDIIPGERAIGYRGVFYLSRFPIFYLPIFRKDLKKLPRQSGIVNPSVGRSTFYGPFVGLGYYWAISRSYDFLYDGIYYSSRGLASNVNFRAKIKPGTDFGFHIYGVDDRGINEGNGIIQKQGGYEITALARSDLGDGWSFRGQLDYLTSFLFRQAFSQSFQGAIFSEARSDAILTKHWDSFGVDVVAERDEAFEDITPSDRIITNKLPEVDFLSRDRQILEGPIPLWFSFNSSAGLLDRTEPDYQTRRFVDRLDVYPELTTSFHLGDFDITPSVAVRETNYGESFVNGVVSGQDVLRSSHEAHVNIVLPSLEKIFKAPKWMGGQKVKHVIETRIQYDYVGGINNFDRIIHFDENDLVSDTNQVTLSVTNRFYVKDKDGNVNEVLSWEVAQARYFDPTFGGAAVPGQRNVVASSLELDGFAFLDGPRNYSPVVSALRFQHVIGMEWRTDYDPLFKRLTNSTVSADWRFSKYLISLGHNLVHTDPVVSPISNQMRATFGIGDTNKKGLSGAISAYYDYKRDILVFATTQLTYNTDCCGFSVEYRRYNLGVRDDTQFKFAFALSNVGTFGNLKRQERIF